MNLKNETLEIDGSRLKQIEDVLKIQHTRIAGNLLTTLFGIFTKKNTAPKVRKNILKLAPIVWDAAADNEKYKVGFKLDHFSLHLDDETLQLGNSFLEKCNGMSYKSEGSRSRELNDLLERLIEAHNGLDNFHHEVPIAKQIKKYINEESDILPEIEENLIYAVLLCRIGNGNWYHEGVSPGGKPIYNKIIQLFNSRQVNVLIKCMTEPEICNQFNIDNCVKHTKQLLKLINSDLQDSRTRQAIELILENIDVAKTNIFQTKEIKDVIKYITD